MKDSINRIGDLTEENYLFPKHLKPCVIHGALFIHNGKDVQDKLNRTEQVLNKLGPKLSAYAMALLVLPELIKKTQESEEYKEFADKLHSQTVH